MSVDLLERALGHDRWTTERLLTLSQDLNDEQLDREFDIGRRSLRMTFDHMILAVETWAGLMAGEPVRREHRPTSVDDYLLRHRNSYDRFANLARDLAASGRLDETFVDHHSIRQSYGATILQVILHNTHHRGEILHILQRLGMKDLPDGDPQEWEHSTGRI